MTMNSTDGEYGRQLEDGSWSGYVGLVHSGVWIMLLVTVFVCTIILGLLIEALKISGRQKRTYNFWFLLKSMGQEGAPCIAPEHGAIRLFLGSWWIFITVMLWSYGGTLTSFMAYPGRRPAVDTIPKLRHALNDRTIRYGTITGTTYEKFLMTNMAEVDPVFRDSLLENPGLQMHSVEEGVDQVLEQPYAFVYMKMVLKWHAAARGEDLFRLARDIFSVDAIGIAIQKCHPCRRSFSYIVDRLEETGFLTKWYDDSFERAQRMSTPVTVNTYRPLSMDDLQGAFYLLVIGTGLGTAMLLVEFVIRIIREDQQTFEKAKKVLEYRVMPKRDVRPRQVLWICHHGQYHLLVQK